MKAFNYAAKLRAKFYGNMLEGKCHEWWAYALARSLPCKSIMLGRIIVLIRPNLFRACEVIINRATWAGLMLTDVINTAQLV